ncbi:hypothetical protein IJJ27_04240 [bacterium]|nr:hypothetical protein [bacterium]
MLGTIATLAPLAIGYSMHQKGKKQGDYLNQINQLITNLQLSWLPINQQLMQLAQAGTNTTDSEKLELQKQIIQLQHYFFQVTQIEAPTKYARTHAKFVDACMYLRQSTDLIQQALAQPDSNKIELAISLANQGTKELKEVRKELPFPYSLNFVST